MVSVALGAGITSVEPRVRALLGTVGGRSMSGYVRGMSASGTWASSWAGGLFAEAGALPWLAAVAGVGEMVREGAIDGVMDGASEGVTVVSLLIFSI